MSEYPLKLWKYVLEIKSGRNQKQVENPDGLYPIYGSGGIMGYADNFICNEGSTIIGRKGTINRPIYVDRKFWNVDTAFGLSPFNSLEGKFLYYFCLGYDFTKHDKGTTLPSLVKQDLLENILIPVPPIEEQKRIVEILDKAFEGIAQAEANTRRNLINARELFDSYLNKFFANNQHWIETTVEKLVNNHILAKPLDGNHGEIHPKKSDFVKAGVPFIMASDLEEGQVNQENCNFISRQQADSLRKGFAIDGDVLLSHKGTIGRTAILNTSHQNIVLTPQVTYYRIIDKTKIFNEFLYYYFKSQKFQRQINDIASGGSTRAYIGITKQLDLKIVYTDLDIQQETVQKFRSIEREIKKLETIYQRKLEAIAELKQSILEKAFTGQLSQ
ncbi:restriction endonuclease subunit S [Microcystis aeruginosa CS-563/04]|uniref:restriction endonuclease subunit S n=1 Tax=Microcystis aeruginosa TaxID=1126 RepID=UPI00232F2F63|nr:restriction endonuclease subunit S [Microcystis aeruginosa]MDB9422300.1 restriction endonuclease subunit S [Microcystis aeruginosa CS-563/04]